MKLSLTFACLSAIVISTGSTATAVRAGDDVMSVSTFLCDTSVHAVQFAAAKAEGDGDEIAKDRVGRIAKREVCGRYSGQAKLESETVVLKDGVAYRITSFRFREDRRRAWMAETSFAAAPFQTGWDL